MAKKQIEGQMDLFELFDSVEEFEEKIKGVPQPPALVSKTDTSGVVGKTGTPVMKKGFYDTEQNMSAVVAYLDYNQVYVKGWGNAEPVIYQFEQSKEAVDFYLKQLEFFLRDRRKLKVEEEPAVLPEAVVKPWNNEGDI